MCASSSSSSLKRLCVCVFCFIYVRRRPPPPRQEVIIHPLTDPGFIPISMKNPKLKIALHTHTHI